MVACFAGRMCGRRLAAMDSITGHRSRRRRQPLFEGPVLFKRSRLTIIELAALVWLVAKLAPLARSFFESPGRGAKAR